MIEEIDPISIVEWFDERAAMHEFEAGLARILAESLALRDVSERYGKPAAKLVQRHRENMQ